MPNKKKPLFPPEPGHILAEDLYQIALEVCSCPTAPGMEHHVINKVLCLIEGLPFCTVNQDEFGNIIAIYDHESAGREPFRLVAHMDHPAFVVKGEKEVWLRGGVKSDYFHSCPIRFHSLGGAEPLGVGTTVAHFKEEESKTGATYRLTLAEPAPTGADFAVWDLPGPTCSKRTPADQEQWDKLLKKTKAPLARPGDALFIAPACDDLIEVSTMIALLRHLAKSRAKACVHFLFTRCEETGFYGALAALESKMPLPKVTTISLEISNSVGFATVGGGPILRVGDRVSVFDSTITQWLSDSFQARPSAAGASAGAGGDLPFTRKLMAGGACEGSVFHLAGIPTGALCLPMFNYHNMGADNQIQSEMVSLMDWQSLYTGLLYLATEASSIAQSIERLKTKFAGYRVQALAALG